MGATIAKGYDPVEVRQRTCQTCGMLLDDVGEFHPFVFCVLKKAGRDPWADILWVTEQLGIGGDLPAKPPLVRTLNTGPPG
jgi:hypothetical protein